MKRAIMGCIALLTFVVGNAQDFVDNALHFSRTQSNGSARMQGLGGSHVALGGDYSAAFSNPAGLGFFNRSELTFSAGLRLASSSSDYFGEKSKDSRNTFNIPGLSLVLHRPSEREEGFLGGSFAITLNRTNDLNQNFRYAGTNSNNTIVQSFLDDANGIYFNNEILDPGSLAFGQNNFYNLTGLAFNNYLIDTLRANDGSIFYSSPLTVYWDENGETGSVRQIESSQRTGAQYQWSIAYGANFSDKFFLGASLGLTTLRFRLKQTYAERDFVFNSPNAPTSDPGFEYPAPEFQIEETYDIRGSGVNFTVGAIYRPIDNLQVGLSYVTPTATSITDEYKASIKTEWFGYEYYPGEELESVNERFDVPVVSEYDLRTPGRLTFGLAYITKKGFISAETEFVDHANAKYSSDDGDFNEDNSTIRDTYKSVVNMKIGGEYRIDEWRLRGGVNYLADPYQNSEVNRALTTIHTGGGYRGKRFYIDGAAIFSTTSGQRSPYFTTENSPRAQQDFRSLSFVFTIGFPF